MAKASGILKGLLAGVLLLGWATTAFAELIVIHRHAVARHNITTGEQLSRTEEPRAETLDTGVVGPDGHIYATGNSLGVGSIMRYDGSTGLYRDMFVDEDNTELTTPTAIAFGPDGDVYVSSIRFGLSILGRVFRFDGTTGAEKGKFVIDNQGALTQPNSITFGSEGHLYVADGANGILRFDGKTGATLGVFIPPEAGVPASRSILFGPDGNFYSLAGDVRKYGRDGTFLNVVVRASEAGLIGASAMVFGPNGDIYVAEYESLLVKRFSASGEAKGVFVQWTPAMGDGLTALSFSIPKLSVSQDASGGAVVKWPAVYANYTLISKGELGGSGSWDVVNASQTTADGNVSVTVSVTGSQYFRLRAD